MKIKDVIEKLEARALNIGTVDTVNGGYCGDFLSNVISKAPSGSAWFTVMNNVNVAGVALLAEINLIILCENVDASPDMLERCKQNDISVISTRLDVFCAVKAFLG